MAQNTLDKYENYYQSVKDLVINTKLAKDTEIEGIDKQTIDNFEKQYQMKFPPAVRSFLQFFGEKIAINDAGLLNFTLPGITKAVDVAVQHNVDDLLQSQRIPDYNDEETFMEFGSVMNVNSVLYIRWDEMRSGLSFIDSSKENPEIFSLMEFRSFTTDSWTFTNYVRTILFLLLSSKFYEESEKGSSTISTKIEWASKYVALYKKNSAKLLRALNDRRFDFNVVVSKIEEDEDRIFTVDEFEWAFLAHLEEMGYQF